jgi:hypothetical protein
MYNQFLNRILDTAVEIVTRQILNIAVELLNKKISKQ